MLSPFPGMDPYLEGEFWPGFHAEFAIEIKRQLVPKLQPRYFPFTEKYQIRALLVEIALGLEPDVAISKTSKAPLPGRKISPSIQPVGRTLPLTRKMTQTRIVIRDVGKRRLVTAIEILSPANKYNPGRKQYLRKREHILASRVNLIEIDLHRKGRRPPLVEAYPEGDYFALLSRARSRPRCDVYSINLHQALPTIPVPLLPEDDDVDLDLQAAFAQAYDLGGWAGIIKYQKPPEIRLTKDQVRWSKGLLP